MIDHASESAADDGYPELAEKIARETSFRCTSYKDRCVRRRIAVRMRARGAPTFRDYTRLLDEDAGEYQQLLDTLTVNVTKFFRNPSAYASLGRNVIPELWGRNTPIRAWSAGSASGEEAFSIALMFYEQACAAADTASVERVSVTGSDIDRASLDASHRAMYLPGAFADTTPEQLERYFPVTREGRTVLREARAIVRFERRDILQEPVAEATYDLIACRNVVIYLDRASQEQLLDQLVDALKPGGYLMMGHVETLFGKARRRLTPVDVRERIFRKQPE
ncbi:MAG: protein-glutamate O-methyltransferase CheR [Gemmatimonadota bacterium]|nr:protein-glutamate O-methyltransferase CheR [Gemmatimonadota bacterium]